MDSTYTPISPRTRSKIYTNWKMKSQYYKELVQASQDPALSCFPPKTFKCKTPTSESLHSTTLNRTKSMNQINESGFSTDTSAEIEIVCTNCYAYVSIEEVDNHSLACTKPVSPSEEVSLINMRIQKLLESIIRKEAGACGGKKNTLQKIRTVAHLSLTSKETEKLLEGLQGILAHSSGLSCCIYAKRLASLLELRLFVTTKESEISPERFQQWKSRTEYLLGLAKGKTQNEGLGDLEKHFYSLCIKKKAELSKDHPKQDLPISLVYDRVKEIGIRFSKWEEFIDIIYS